MYLLLKRNYKESAAWGTLSIDGEFFCYTLERPWLNNITGISCIPEGIYQIAKHNSVKYRDVFRLENVPKRSGILIHSGNKVSHSLGCILVGEKIHIDDTITISQSVKALDRLRVILNKELKSNKKVEIEIC